MESMGVATGCGVRRCIDFFILLIPTPLVSVLFYSSIPFIFIYHRVISRDEPDSPLTQYITIAGISRARYYTITLFKHNHRVLQLISNRISV